MKAYRLTSFEDLVFASNGVWAMPAPFEANEDSSIPSGNWSFWFASARQIGITQVIVEGDFTPCLEGVMSWEQVVRDYGWDDLEVKNLECPEFVTKNPQRVTKIWIGDIFVTPKPIGEYNSSNRGYGYCSIGLIPSDFHEVLSNTSVFFRQSETIVMQAPKTPAKYKKIDVELLNTLYPGLYAGCCGQFDFLHEASDVTAKIH